MSAKNTKKSASTKEDTSIKHAAKPSAADRAKKSTVKNAQTNNETIPVKTESAEDVSKVTLNPVLPDEAKTKEVAKVEKAAGEEIAKDLQSSDTQKELTQEIAREVIQEQPQNAADLTHKEVEKIVAPVVKDLTKENLEHRSTVPAMETKIKTETKTRFKGLRDANKAKGSKKAAEAKAEVTTAAASPLGVSPEAQMVVAENAEPNHPDALAAIEKENQRLADQAAGKINDHEEMQLGKSYHFRALPEKNAEPGAKVDEFVGTLTELPKAGKISVSTLKSNQPGGVREIAAKDYQINEVETSRAYELSHIL